MSIKKIAETQSRGGSEDGLPSPFPANFGNALRRSPRLCVSASKAVE